MNQAKAERALRAVERKYGVWIKLSREDGITDPEQYPQLRKNGVGPYVTYSIVWESNSPDEWAIKWGSEKKEDPAGIFMEPIMSFVLGVYDA